MLSQTPRKGPKTILINIVTNAILGTIAKYPVTIVGDPSYTSGTHI